jgi:hypothetical protein
MPPTHPALRCPDVRQRLHAALELPVRAGAVCLWDRPGGGRPRGGRGDSIHQTDAGHGYYFRVYLAVGILNNVASLANRLSPNAAKGPAAFTEGTADREPIFTQIAANGQTVLTTTPQSGQTSVFYTYAEPVANSLPLFVLRATDSGRLRLSTNPCELCSSTHTRGGTVLKPYDGSLHYVSFLGYVLPAKFVKNKDGLPKDVGSCDGPVLFSVEPLQPETTRGDGECR